MVPFVAEASTSTHMRDSEYTALVEPNAAHRIEAWLDGDIVGTIPMQKYWMRNIVRQAALTHNR